MRLDYHLSLITLALLAFQQQHHHVVGVQANDGNDESSNFAVSAYFPDYRKDMDINATVPFLTDLILFSVELGPNGQVQGDHICCLGSYHYKIGRQAKEAKRISKNDAADARHLSSLRLWVSIGGAGRSRHFANVASQPESIKALANNLLELVRKEEIDGVDFDYEAPRTKEEFINYMRLVISCANVLHRDNRLVSIALHPGQLLPAQVYDVVDRIHVMTYDMVSGGGYHSDFGKTVGAMKQFLDGGKVPAAKLLLGIPMYGRGLRNPGVAKAMYEIVDDARGDETILITKSSLGDMHWESQELLQRKVEWAKMNGLGGVFIWEIGQDYRKEQVAPGGILLEGIHKAVANRRLTASHGQIIDEL